MKKISAILFLCLLICNVLGFTFISLWNEWEESHRVKSSSAIERINDELVFKMQLTLPYQNQFQTDLIKGYTAIYEGEFYESYQQVYKNDTLYTYYRHLTVSRDNVLSLMQKVHENLNIFPDNHQTAGQRALKFFKNFSKDYVRLYSSIIAWFWLENIDINHNYQYLTSHTNPTLVVDSPPPIS